MTIDMFNKLTGHETLHPQICMIDLSKTNLSEDIRIICDFYGLELYDFLEAGDVLGDSGYEFEGLHDANHNVGKALIALEAATYL